MVAFEKQPLLDLQKKLAADLGCELFLLINLQWGEHVLLRAFDRIPFQPESAKRQSANGNNGHGGRIHGCEKATQFSDGRSDGRNYIANDFIHGFPP